MLASSSSIYSEDDSRDVIDEDLSLSDFLRLSEATNLALEKYI